MAEAVVSFALEFALEKLAEDLMQQIGLYAGAARELERIKETYQSIKAYLRDAESKQVAEESVRRWLSRLKGIALDIEDVLDEWLISGQENRRSNNDIGHKVRTCLLSPYASFDRSVSRCKIARQIKEIRERFDQIAGDRIVDKFSINSNLGGENTPIGNQRQTSSLMEASEIIGRVEDKETVINSLVSGSSSGDADGKVYVTAILGIGGLGKTTLAQLIYNDVKVKEHFNQALYWVCVSQDFDVKRLIKAITQEVKKKVDSTLSELNSLQNELLESLRGKRFLLVLDDVWNEEDEKWKTLRHSLQSGAQGSRILVTTRSEKVANIMNAAYIHRLKGLSDDLSWTLFSSRAFAGWEAEEHLEFESIGRQIVSKCSRVPLSITVMGSTMNSKRTRGDWQNILESTIWSLPQVADKILPALILSYYNLPPCLKQCFAYCSIFRKDTTMSKHELVNLWVAQGFIHPQGRREMEDIAEEYFNDLVACSMFQEIEQNLWGETTCKMHDLLHDLAEFIMKDESCIFPDENSHNQCSIDVRHASLFSSQDNPIIPISSFQAKKLRTLYVLERGIDLSLVDLIRQARFLRALLCSLPATEKQPEIIGKLKHLRYLDLSWSAIAELPIAFEKMKHLRYLDLSFSNVVELPESMSHLVNLHTLNLKWCRYLKKLPRGIGGMVSLRHLEIESTSSLECLPKGLGRIICLQNLCKFMVGGEGGCGIDELQRLNSLQGSLEIEHLERVSSPEEARKAELRNKSHLRKLVFHTSLDWDVLISGRIDAEEERMENVLNGLRPHPNLEELELNWYYSSSKSKLPSWMEDSSFSKLTELVIRGFRLCEENLLGLGKLPALKKLELWGVGVRKMGDEFYYGMSGNEAVGERRGAAFPKLERLFLEGMNKLEEWELASQADDAPKVMPSLRQLEIVDCPVLRVLPDSLGQLESLEKLGFDGCQKLVSLPHSLGQLKKLNNLEIRGAEALTCLPDWLGQLESLEHLAIRGCQKLEWPPLSSGKLKSLEISGDEVLNCLSRWVGQLGSLECLTIVVGQQLEWPLHLLRQLHKLRDLEIIDAEALTCLPDSLGQLESLEELTIDGCQKLVSLPHSLGQLKALKRLEIRNCEALESLPHALQDLSLLQSLRIFYCPLLSERCEREGGEDWPKISHIPDIYIS